MVYTGAAMTKTYSFDIFAMTSPKTEADILALLNEVQAELAIVQEAFQAITPCAAEF